MQKTTTDLNLLIDGFARMLARVLGEASTLSWNPGDSLPNVDVDAGLIEQCLINLALNARDAMPGGGRLTVATEAVEIFRNNAKKFPEGRTGTFACLSVTDTGSGMERDTLQHIFEPFFTTKGVGKGSGLGLASVYGIIQQHDGWIDVSSSPGSGTTFRIFFPAAAKRKPKKSDGHAAGAKSEPRGGTETVLVVEDEPSVRQLVALGLKHAGYTVLEAECGPDALKLFEKFADKIHLLLTDMVMPGGISGAELARRLRTRAPELRVIMTSGYSEEIQRKQASDGSSIFLAKPYTPQKLVETVRAALDSPASASGRSGALLPKPG